MALNHRLELIEPIADVINITAVTIFGVEHRFNDGFTYGDSFWVTVCSTIASTLTNVTLIMDYVQTPDFARSGKFYHNPGQYDAHLKQEAALPGSSVR